MEETRKALEMTRKWAHNFKGVEIWQLEICWLAVEGSSLGAKVEATSSWFGLYSWKLKVKLWLRLPCFALSCRQLESVLELASPLSHICITAHSN